MSYKKCALEEKQGRITIRRDCSEVYPITHALLS